MGYRLPMLLTLRRLTRRLCALLVLMGFGLSAVESLSCAEEQGLELVSEHATELQAATAPDGMPDGKHCCPCIHTFVTTVRAVVVVAPQLDHLTAFTFLLPAPTSHRAEPLLPPPIA